METIGLLSPLTKFVFDALPLLSIWTKLRASSMHLHGL